MTSSPTSSESSAGQRTTLGNTPPSAGSDAGSILEPSDTEALVAITKVRRKPIPRKGHSKSKRGCYNCKRRRVKCSEELPRCRHCARNDVDCEYPPRPKTISPRPGTPLRTTPTVFGLEDLRFFHHFLLRAYPPVPYGSQATWQFMASMVHEYDFLAHALLGLAAQHLTLTTDADYSPMALNHRVAAMKSLNEALSKPCSSQSDGDSRYGAMLALAFQASCMPDAMMDLLVTMRGCMVIATMVMNLEDSSFKDFTRESYIESFRRLIATPSISTYDEGVLDEISASLRIVAPLCQSIAELKYLSHLERIVQLARNSVAEACLELAIGFSFTNKMTDEEFVSFTSPSNHAAKILLAHFFVLDHVIETWTLGSNCIPYSSRRSITISWVEKVASRLPASYKRYMVWPLGSVHALKAR